MASLLLIQENDDTRLTHPPDLFILSVANTGTHLASPVALVIDR